MSISWGIIVLFINLQSLYKKITIFLYNDCNESLLSCKALHACGQDTMWRENYNINRVSE